MSAASAKAAKRRRTAAPAAAALTLGFHNCQQTRRINARRLRAIIKSLLRQLAVTSGDLGVVLMDARAMTHINETFLRHAGSTDVITFDYRTLPSSSTSNSPPGAPVPLAASSSDTLAPGLHGELCVCVDVAVAQARRFHVHWQSEVVRYIVHGLLHLLGFDDREPGSRRRMKRQEDRLLKHLAGRFELDDISLQG